MRGVGVHHAGVLPKYRRVVEELFQRKLLSVAVCTETLAAGINLPARSVVVPSIMKGPPEKKKLLDPSTAHQIFGRAGRPQFDKLGHVFVLAHEDDVKIARWREKYDQIPEDTKDPGLLRAKKSLKKKMPTRRSNEQYWTEAQFHKLCAAPPGKLHSRGPLPWRLLAYMLDASPEVELIRRLVGKRLMEPGRHRGRTEGTGSDADYALAGGLRHAGAHTAHDRRAGRNPSRRGGRKGQGSQAAGLHFRFRREAGRAGIASVQAAVRPGDGKPSQAAPLSRHPPAVRGFPDESLGPCRPQRADPGDGERAGAAGVGGPFCAGAAAGRAAARPAGHPAARPAPAATRPGHAGGAFAERPKEDDDEGDRRRFDDGERKWILTLAEKLRRLFDYDFPGVRDLRTTPVWAAGELLQFGGDFNNYVTSKALQKQEGMLFRHLLRLILLVGEFVQLCPPDVSEEEWRGDLDDIAARLTESLPPRGSQQHGQGVGGSGAGDGIKSPLARRERVRVRAVRQREKKSPLPPGEGQGEGGPAVRKKSPLFLRERVRVRAIRDRLSAPTPGGKRFPAPFRDARQRLVVALHAVMQH